MVFKATQYTDSNDEGSGGDANNLPLHPKLAKQQLKRRFQVQSWTRGQKKKYIYIYIYSLFSRIFELIGFKLLNVGNLRKTGQK